MELRMSRKERDRLKVVAALAERRLRQRAAAGLVGLSERQVRRLLAVTGQYYIRGGALVSLGRDEKGILILKVIKPAALASLFESVACLKELTKDHANFIEVPAICTEQDAKLILHAAAFQAAIPPIRVLTRCPVLIERDGKLVQVCGYDRASGIYAAGEPAPDVPLDEAVALLDEMMAEFRFATPADRARALAAITTPSLVFGGHLRGRAPIDLGEADQSQSGKGYRNKVTAAIHGCIVKTVTQMQGGVGSLEETFNTALVRGYNFVSLDNVRGAVNSPAIESFMTEDSYQARVPYQPSVEIDPRRVIVQMTSNKADVTIDLANRSSCVRILKQEEGHLFREYPEGNLLQHVQANQPKYLGAVFAIVRAWHAAGKPRTRETRHDFRPWAQTLVAYTADMPGDARLFNVPEKTAEMLKADLRPTRPGKGFPHGETTPPLTPTRRSRRPAEPGPRAPRLPARRDQAPRPRAASLSVRAPRASGGTPRRAGASGRRARRP